MSRARCAVLVTAVALFVGVVALYWPATSHPFINYDDDTYLTANEHVRAGLSAAGAAWAFTTFLASNWHPLTWLSHMLDVQLFGMDPGRHHLINVSLHAVNALLLFLALRQATGALWRSAAAAALFALHPLRVESVAWAAERKDVLSVCFGLMATLWYLRYLRQPAARRFAGVVVLYACSLLAKPLLVTLPALLILLDFWPLGRFNHPARRASGAPRGTFGRVIAEKSPLVALALGSSLATLHAQTQSGTLARLADYPLAERLVNATNHCGRYLGKSLFPAGLSVFYPPEAPGQEWLAVGVLAALALITLTALLKRDRFPFFAVGWLWFLVALLPVCGLVQVGAQSIADRYTHLPHMGLGLLVAWGAHLAGGRRSARRSLPLLAAAVCLALAAATRHQLHFWRDSATLFRHALAVTDRNWVAHYRLGLALEGLSRPEEAAASYRRVLAIRPHDGWAFFRLGSLAMQFGRNDEAFTLYQRALFDPAAPPEAENNMGVILARENRIHEAEVYYRRALARRPSYLQARLNLGLTLASQGRHEEALAELREVLRAEPGHPGAQAAVELVLSGGAERSR